jgi:hypothetical protein
MPSLLVFNRVYRREIQPVTLVFSTGFVAVSLVSSLSLPCGNKYTVYTYTVCKWWEYWVIGGEGPQTDKTPAAKSLYRSIFLDNDIWHCILSV